MRNSSKSKIPMSQSRVMGSTTTTGLLAFKPLNEEGESPDYPNLQNLYDSSQSHRILIWCSSIYKAVRGLLQKVCLVFKFFRPRRRTPDDPLLPIQDSSVPLICSPRISNGSSAHSVLENTTFEYENVDEENHSNAVDIASLPAEIGCLISSNSQEIIEEIAHANVPQSVVLEEGEGGRRGRGRGRKGGGNVPPTQSVVEREEEEDELQIKCINVVVGEEMKKIKQSSNKGPSSSSSSYGEKEKCSTTIDINEVVEGGGDVPESRRSYASIVAENINVVPVNNIPSQHKVEKEKKAVHAVEGEERKIKYYSNRHKILLVGEGDFSFSACLAVAFGSSATNIIATSLNPKEFLEKNYGSAMSNIEELRSRGGKVMHGIDATEIANHEFLRQHRYDRIVFNFPFAGFFSSNMSPELQLRRHRRLVSLFLKNAKQMISEDGEIHVSHKTNGVHSEFNLESIASSHGLRLIAAVKFKCANYPGYNPKYGFGGDKNFNCYPSKTFKFGLKV